jgi:hypothetical protein
MRHTLWLGLFAVALLAAEAAPVRADLVMPGPGGWLESRMHPRPPRDPDSQPAENAAEPVSQQGAIDPVSGLPYPPPKVVDPPKRTGPFRSCGSGVGVGLAGIGVAWAMLWLGNRFAGRVKGSRSPSAHG